MDAKNRLHLAIDTLTLLFSTLGLPNDETMYQALVELADYLKRARGYAEYQPVLLKNEPLADYSPYPRQQPKAKIGF